MCQTIFFFGGKRMERKKKKKKKAPAFCVHRDSALVDAYVCFTQRATIWMSHTRTWEQRQCDSHSATPSRLFLPSKFFSPLFSSFCLLIFHASSRWRGSQKVGVTQRESIRWLDGVKKKIKGRESDVRDRKKENMMDGAGWFNSSALGHKQQGQRLLSGSIKKRASDWLTNFLSSFLSNMSHTYK